MLIIPPPSAAELLYFRSHSLIEKIPAFEPGQGSDLLNFYFQNMPSNACARQIIT